MNYTVNITAAAEHDMANAADYIEFVPKTLLQRKIISLSMLFQKKTTL